MTVKKERKKERNQYAKDNRGKTEEVESGGIARPLN